jgi:hypothetical protein
MMGVLRQDLIRRLKNLNEMIPKTNRNQPDTVLMSVELFNEIRNLAGETAVALENDIDIPIYDQEEIYHNCTVQVLFSSYTGDSSVGWWKEGDAE